MEGTTNLQPMSLVQPHVRQEQTIDHDQGEQKATNVDAGCPILTMRNDVSVVFNMTTFVVLDYYICGVVVIDSLPFSSLGSGSCLNLFACLPCWHNLQRQMGTGSGVVWSPALC